MILSNMLLYVMILYSTCIIWIWNSLTTWIKQYASFIMTSFHLIIVIVTFHNLRINLFNKDKELKTNIFIIIYAYFVKRMNNFKVLSLQYICFNTLRSKSCFMLDSMVHVIDIADDTVIIIY